MLSFLVLSQKINSLEGKVTTGVYTKMFVRNQPATFQVECGASVNTIPKALVHGAKISNGPISPRMWKSSKAHRLQEHVL